MSKEMPLYCALVREAEQNKIRMHMPGHKGIAFPGFDPERCFSIDYTELRQTGNLYEGVPPIADAERLMAVAYGAENCFFLTGGATQGIMTAMAAVCKPGSRVLIDRGSHKSVWSAMVHLGLDPEYIYPDRVEPWDIAAPITAEQVAVLLDRNTDIAAVLITSPTYYGVCSDVSAIAQISHQRNIPLIVDAAHGAHFPYLNIATASELGADLMVCSAHKTLPVFGSGAMLFANSLFDPAEIRRRSSLFGTSSPSYLVMASMDAARAYLEHEGGERYREVARGLIELRKTVRSQSGFIPFEAGGDPARLVVNTSVAGLSGYKAAELLEADYHIVPEMADARNVVLLFTCADSAEQIGAVERALLDLCLRSAGVMSAKREADCPKPVKKMSPREAAYAKTTQIPLPDSAGRIAGEPLSLYPPGIPAVAPGEELQSEHIEYLRANGFDRLITVIE